jgi:hypothetical protein
MATIVGLDKRMTSHENVCEYRYETISARLKRIEKIGITVAGAIIMLLLGVVLKLN